MPRSLAAALSLVAVASADLDAQRKRASLHRFDAGLRPVGDPVPVTPGEEWTQRPSTTA